MTLGRECEPVCGSYPPASPLAGRADRNSNTLRPFLEENGVSTSQYPATQPHAPDHAKLNVPGGRVGLAASRRMPAVGYTGHLRGKRGDATQCFGTSPWRAEAPVSRAESAQANFALAEEIAVESLGKAYVPPEDRVQLDQFEC